MRFSVQEVEVGPFLIDLTTGRVLRDGVEQQPAAVFLTGFPGAKQDAVDPGLYELKDAFADDERQSAGSFPAPRFGCGRRAQNCITGWPWL